MPTTITGSIGVAAGKFAFDGLMEKLGVTADSIKSQDLLDAEHLNPSQAEIDDETWTNPGGDDRGSTIFTRMTKKQKLNFSRSLDASYSWFKAQVGVGRKMTPEQVEAVAQGRVWTGNQALKNGLVDRLGSLDSTIFYAKQDVLGDIHAKHVYIEPSFAVQLSRFLSNSYSVAQLTSTLVAMAADQDPSERAHSTRVEARLPGTEYVK
jgi:ClpP class serine protease